MFPLLTDAVKPFVMWSCRLAMSLLAQSNTRCFGNHSRMHLPVASRLFFFLRQLWRVEIFDPNIYFVMKRSILWRSPNGGGKKRQILVMCSHFLASLFSSVTVGILGTEQKNLINSEYKVTFSFKLVYEFFSTSELGCRPRSVRNRCLSHASSVIIAGV